MDSLLPETTPVPGSGALSMPLAEDAARARAYARHARADNTQRAYRADWADFRAWCASRGVAALPAAPESVALYVASRADAGPDGDDGRPGPGLRVSTLERRLSAINQAHRAHGHSVPASRREEPLHSVWAGLVRTRGTAPDKVAPALPDDLRCMIEAMPRGDDGQWTLRSLRDRALLLVGFGGALRRSELAALRAEHLSVTADGLRLVVPRSKADQAGRGATLGIHYGTRPATCPVRALRSWMAAARAATGAPLDGAVFRKIDRWEKIWERALTPGAIAVIVKGAARRAGLDAALYSGHSLRAGFATQAARAGKHERAIMRHTRHTSERMLREYIREGTLFDENPTDGIGL